MESSPEQGFRSLQPSPSQTCGRMGCACGLPIGERFVLGALRQWQQDRALPEEGSALHRGFKTAGLLDALPASLDVMMAPTASCVAALRLKSFAVALSTAGMRLSPLPGAAGARLN